MQTCTHSDLSLSQFGPFVKDASHPYEPPSQEVISVVKQGSVHTQRFICHPPFTGTETKLQTNQVMGR